MKSMIDYLYRFDRRLVVPIFGCEKDLDFFCMNNVTIAKALGFRSFCTGNLEKIIPVDFVDCDEAASFPWQSVADNPALQQEVDSFSHYLPASPVPLGGGSFGPLTVAADILGIENCVRIALKKPDVLNAVIDKATEFIMALAKQEARLGAEFFWLAEPVASLFSPELLKRCGIRQIKEIFAGVDIPGCLHVCGNTQRHTEVLLETGLQLLSIDYVTDLQACLKAVPENIVIMGNVNPMLIWGGTAEDVQKETERVLHCSRYYKNFILSTGCMVPWDAPPENAEVLKRCVLEQKLPSNEEYRLIRGLANGEITDIDSLPEWIIKAAEEIS